MTVKELLEKLSKMNGSERVVVQLLDAQAFFEIDEVALKKGTPDRNDKGKVSFRFDGKGPS